MTLTIFGRNIPPCQHCKDAVQFCDNNSIPYTYHDIGEHPHLRDIIIQAGMRTIPCIFDGEELIGGCDDLKKKYQSDPFDTLFD